MLQDGKVLSSDLREPGEVEDLTFWRRNIGEVILELLSDPRFCDHQHFRFEVYRNSQGQRVFGEANGCLSFQLNAYRIGAGIVPVSIVMFIDASFIHNNIYVRPIYGE